MSTTNFYEHETIFLDAPAVVAEMGLTPNQSLQSSSFNSFVRRLDELTEWVKRGHTLIIFNLHPAPFIFVKDRQQAKSALEQLSPFNLVTLTVKSGISTHIVAQQKEVADLLIGSSGPYQCVISGPELEPLIAVKTTKNSDGPLDVIAGYVPLGKGFVIFAPQWISQNNDIRLTLANLPSLFRPPKQSLPDWIDRYVTSAESSVLDKRRALNLEIERLQAQVASLEDQIENDRQFKQLFAGSGSQFESAVADALMQLGLKVVPGPHPRADLLVSDGVRIAAVEAKGVEGTTKEEYVRQVTMWMPDVDAALSTPLEVTADDPIVNQYKEKLKLLDLSNRDTSEDCKGVLVIGTYRSLPIELRSEPDFVENVQQVLRRRDVCALTGLQLFSLVLMARSDPPLAQTVRKAIFDTKGVLQLAQDWRLVLTHDQGA